MLKILQIVPLALSSLVALADEGVAGLYWDESLRRLIVTGIEASRVQIEVENNAPAGATVRWTKNDTLLEGVEGVVLELTHLTVSDTGVYRPLAIINNSIVDKGQEALVIVNKLTSPSNISSRFYIDAPKGIVAIIGFVVPPGGHPRPTIVRAIGETLTNYGIENPGELKSLGLFNEKLEKIREFSPGFISENDRTRFKEYEQYIGAFPSGDKDIRGRITLEPGIYTMLAEALPDTNGIVLLEVYFTDFGL